MELKANPDAVLKVSLSKLDKVGIINSYHCSKDPKVGDAIFCGPFTVGKAMIDDQGNQKQAPPSTPVIYYWSEFADREHFALTKNRNKEEAKSSHQAMK